MAMPYKEPYSSWSEERKERHREVWRAYYHRNPKRLSKAALKTYFRRRKTKEGLSRIREVNALANSKRRFGIDRKAILTKYNHKCVYCGKEGKIVHHLDNVGRRTKAPHNDISNLVCCCHSCHAYIHLHSQKLQMKI